MFITRALRNSAAAALLLSLTSWATAAPASLDEAMSVDGLQKIKVKDIDVAYARPGASLSGYKSVKLDPVEVAFRKDWNPDRTGSRLKLSADDREKIRSGLAKVVHDEFVRELQAKGSYPVVGEAGPDVLRLKVGLVNVYVNAPDTGSPGRSRTYVVSAGEMTLVAELFDSETGQVVARFVDRREARNSGRMEYTNSSLNSGEAQAIASTWARILRRALDRAHGIGSK
jgi:hypothetical protein